jgi:tRNA(Ile)-lysidine synthase
VRKREQIEAKTSKNELYAHKVKKLFSDKKIPLSERKILPLLCDERGVIWVPGFGVRDDNPTTEERRDMFAILAMKE